MKKQGSTIFESESGRSSLNHYSPSDALVLDDPPIPAQSSTSAPASCLQSPNAGSRSTEEELCQTTNNTSVHHHTIMGQASSSLSSEPPKTADNRLRNPVKRPTIDNTALRGDKYKHLTCPSWKSSECRLVEDHCIFAHRDTGCYAPSGYSKAKDFTCPGWRDGRCSLPNKECHYAHADTGFDIGIDRKVSLKHITCYYWKYRGGCFKKRESDCLYAHQETGVDAWQPVKDSQERLGKHSLKEFICPRWAASGRCRWSAASTCPYTHSQSGRSCLEPPKLVPLDDSQLNNYSNNEPSSSLQFPTADDTFLMTADPSTHQSSISSAEKSGVEEDLTQTDRPSPSPPYEPSIEISIAAPVPQIVSVIAPKSSIPAVAKPLPQSTTQESATQPSTEEGAACLPSESHTNNLNTEQTTSKRSIERSPARLRGIGRARPSRGGRSGVSWDPRRGASKPVLARSLDPIETGSVTLLAANPPSMQADKSPHPSLSGLEPATEKCGTKGVKKCEVCNKSIFSSAARCNACSNKMDDQESAHNGTSDVSAHDVPEFTATISNEQMPDLLDVDTQIDPTRIGASTVSLQQYIVANSLKRAAQDDIMFIASKKPKPKQVSLDSAIRSLRQERKDPAGSANVVVEVDIMKDVFDRRTSLERLTNLAIQEKTVKANKSLGISTERLSAFESDSRPSSRPQSPHQTLCRRTRSNSFADLMPNPIDEAEVPPLLSSTEIESTSISQDGSPTPSEQVERLMTEVDDFTEVEHELFTKAFELYPCKFGKIAQSLTGRTYQDCVRHYNVTQASKDYQQLDDKVQDDEETLTTNTVRNSRPGSISHDEGGPNQVDAARRDRYDDVDNYHGCVQDEKRPKLRPRVRKPPDVTPAPTDPTNANTQSPSLLTRTPEAMVSLGIGTERNTDSLLPSRRCPRCSKTHKRCWHKIDGSPDPGKCKRLVEEYGDQGPHWFKAQDWGVVLGGASKAILEDFTNGRRTGQSPRTTENFNNTVNDLRNGEEQSNAVVVPDPVHHDDEEVDDDDARPIRFRPSTSSRPLTGRGSALPPATLDTNNSKLVSQPKVIGQTEGEYRPSFSPLTAMTESRPATAVDQGAQSGLDEHIARLKERGVMFESDSEDDDLSKDDFEPPPPRRIDPLWQRPNRSANLFDIDPSLDMTDEANRWAAAGLARPRPPKKKIIGNLLAYQCRERRKRFGDPHQEVRRYVEGVQITTVVPQGINFDAEQGPQVETETVTMSFRDFIGAPKNPVIEARGDQLVFREREQMQQGLGRNGRAKRVLDSEMFPFVYSSTTK